MSPRSRRNVISYFNVMVVGFSGVGKTSFIKTLLEALKSETSKEKRESLGSLPEHSNNSALDGPLKKTQAPYTVSQGLDVDGEKVMLTLIDTPGFQNSYLLDKQLHDILEYIEHQFDLTLAEESKVKRNPKAVDTQVHACLYVLDPSKPYMDDYDNRILTKLSERVNVIPIIGKADTLTAAQRRRLKPAILNDLYSPKQRIPLYGIPEDDDSDSDDDDDGEEQEDEALALNGHDDRVKDKKDGAETGKEEGKENGNSSSDNDAPAEKPRRGTLPDFIKQFSYEDEDDETQAFLDYLSTIPFTVIAYEQDPETGAPVEMDNVRIGRDYGWGKIDCLSDDYSDFNRLKTTLLSTHRRILQSETVERYYEQYRTERLLVRRATKLKSMDVSKKILEDLNQL